MPTPAPCLLELRRQVDARWPGRGKASDGIMGDPAHRLRKSDHNEGNAIDFTHDPPRFDAHKLADEFRRQMKAYPAGRISYIISNKLITSSASRWEWRRYRGTNPHTSHCHISIRASARNELRPWNLGE